MTEEKLTTVDQVNHPPHYTGHPSGVEAINVTETMSFALGNAFKYVFRRNMKANAKQDLEKAIWYCNRAILTESEYDPESVDELVTKISHSESMGIGLALHLIYVADRCTSDEGRSYLLSQATGLLQKELDSL